MRQFLRKIPPPVVDDKLAILCRIFARMPDWGKRRETDVSRHNGGPIKGPLLAPQYNRTLIVRRISGSVLNWTQMNAERLASLGQLYARAWSSFQPERISAKTISERLQKSRNLFDKFSQIILLYYSMLYILRLCGLRVF